MLNSILDVRKSSITLDRVLMTDIAGQHYITTDHKEIMIKIKQHYIKTFKKCKADFNKLPELFQKEHDSLDEVDPTIHDDLIQLLSLDKVSQILCLLPNNKTTGANGITYKLIKHLKEKNIEVFHWLFGVILKTDCHPTEWLISKIYFIPKLTSMRGSLNNTRLILLIDIICKSFMKLVTKRLSTTIKTHQVLKGPNYAGLPGESVFEPIFILQSLIEHAVQFKKQLWILF